MNNFKHYQEKLKLAKSRASSAILGLASAKYDLIQSLPIKEFDLFCWKGSNYVFACAEIFGKNSFYISFHPLKKNGEPSLNHVGLCAMSYEQILDSLEGFTK